jgi:ribonucleoside-diphosphate reductase alpha chain
MSRRQRARARPRADNAAADSIRAMIESRPTGALNASAEKIEYWTQQGRQTLYLVVSFLPLADGRERVIEFFMPVGQSGESQQWITASMRLLSLAARGAFSNARSPTCARWHGTVVPCIWAIT